MQGPSHTEKIRLIQENNHQFRMDRQKSEKEHQTKRPRYSNDTRYYSKHFENCDRNRFAQQNQLVEKHDSLLCRSNRDISSIRHSLGNVNSDQIIQPF